MMRVGANVVDGLSVTVKEKEMQEMIRRISLSVLLMGLVTSTVRAAVRGEGLPARLRWRFLSPSRAAFAIIGVTNGRETRKHPQFLHYRPR